MPNILLLRTSNSSATLWREPVQILIQLCAARSQPGAERSLHRQIVGDGKRISDFHGAVVNNIAVHLTIDYPF